MDIDSPPNPMEHTLSGGHTHGHLPLPEFSASFPLPFRVLFLIALGIFLWAVNLHILSWVGLDVGWILDFRDRGDGRAVDGLGLGDIGSAGAGRRGVLAGEAFGDGLLTPDGTGPAPTYDLSSPTISTAGGSRRPSHVGFDGVEDDGGKSLYAPVYKLWLLYSACVGGGWALFAYWTAGEPERMEQYRGAVGVLALVLAVSAVGGLGPWNRLAERECVGLKRCFKRILYPSLTAPVFFSDVILADILTSFAKVLGDLYVSASQIWYGGITQGRVRQYGIANYVTLFMICLPYLIRLRQCLAESYQSSWSSPRPLLNSLKYLSALPVILLSAAQKTLYDEIASTKGITAQEAGATRWHGEHRLFRLWLLAVIVNSMFSFYWDVSMDWGLGLLELDTWFPKARPSGVNANPSRRDGGVKGWWGRLRGAMRNGGTGNAGDRDRHGSHQRSPCPTPSHRPIDTSRTPSPGLATTSGPWGLRPRLLLPDNSVYYLFTLIDLVLRFTWSLKLSGHLHTIQEIESGVFLMEALELVRRWMWVFIRVEWEAVKKMGHAQQHQLPRVAQGGTGLGIGMHGVRAEEGKVIWEREKDGI